MALWLLPQSSYRRRFHATAPSVRRRHVLRGQALVCSRPLSALVAPVRPSRTCTPRLMDFDRLPHLRGTLHLHTRYLLSAPLRSTHVKPSRHDLQHIPHDSRPRHEQSRRRRAPWHVLLLLPYAVLDQVTHARPRTLQPAAVLPRDQGCPPRARRRDREAAFPSGNQEQGNQKAVTCSPLVARNETSWPFDIVGEKLARCARCESRSGVTCLFLFSFLLTPLRQLDSCSTSHPRVVKAKKTNTLRFVF